MFTVILFSNTCYSNRTHNNCLRTTTHDQKICWTDIALIHTVFTWAMIVFTLSLFLKTFQPILQRFSVVLCSCSVKAHLSPSYMHLRIQFIPTLVFFTYFPSFNLYSEENSQSASLIIIHIIPPVRFRTLTKRKSLIAGQLKLCRTLKT